MVLSRKSRLHLSRVTLDFAELDAELFFEEGHTEDDWVLSSVV